MPPVSRWAIAVHAGAGAPSPDAPPKPYEHELNIALQAAEHVLHTQTVSIDWHQAHVKPPPLALAAALAAVECLETTPLFNAGKGAVLNERAFVENEAAVIDGATLRTGSVCGLRTVVHPARLATLLYAASPYQMIGFSAAERLADRYPTLIERAEPSWFVTDRRKASLYKARAKEAKRASNLEQPTPTENGNLEREGETVGATVCDGVGNVACVTSTGGLTNKWEGRIGDTPLVGAGSFASNKSCALSGTGIGEEFIRLCAASRVALSVELSNTSLKDAMYDVVHNQFPDDTGGFIGVTPDGEVVIDFNSATMYRGYRTWRGEQFVHV